MMRFLMTLCSALLATSFVHAGSHEFICGTQLPHGAFYADTGSVTCEDGVGAATKELNAKSPRAFCFYNATCLPLTPSLKTFLMKKANLMLKEGGTETPVITRWEEVTDDVANQALIRSFYQDRDAPPQFELPTTFSVQCMGTKTADGAKCPGVNSCVNDRDQARSLFWKVKPTSPTPISLGVQLRKSGDDMPRAVTK